MQLLYNLPLIINDILYLLALPEFNGSAFLVPAYPGCPGKKAAVPVVVYLFVSNGTNCLNLFRPIQTVVSTAASASPSTLNVSPK